MLCQLMAERPDLMLRGTCDPSLDGMRYFEMCFVCYEVEERSGAISLAVHVIWSCDISPTLPINSAPSLFNSQGNGIVHHFSIYIYVQTGLDVRYLNCTCRNQKKILTLSNPPFFRCPRNMRPSSWLGGPFRLNGQPHLSTPFNFNNAETNR
jgi:hypothetical protein